ncbi:hypothetical protein, partial [Nonomuraea maheshkhaliensis]|uniref:hypothetical protein n=1 Tax=Nonomuraea maheshkhaliensis TaxID=419590 RepID=UPI0031FA13FC
MSVTEAPRLIDPLAGNTSSPCEAVATQETVALRALSPILAAPSIPSGHEAPSLAAGAALRRVGAGRAERPVAGLVLGRVAARGASGVRVRLGVGVGVGVGGGGG